ncbi:SLATT domain-containing protein [Winogradskyella sp. SYSU M77433]|uniref:SLATT domain-containing protein n=1 Tax=Winogradskyella sp. SYSU M77433 TaxID=3042722 RepID=UPI0024806295|nr:SLATT domain-containing protein [Winogradskyella sp. SYSU M77433]MDH7911138.1 SLATT domain-containing protein [Winogradskyella sp. SYSU M77433]
MSKKNNQFTGPKKYLEKSFLEELNYKIWSTKAARFHADKRLKIKAKLSNISLAFLSAYLIIASLISVYNINTGNNEDIINYIITALSILVLVVSQFENAQDYKLNAKIFHDCGLELSVLYNDLRVFKTLKKKPSEYEQYTFGKNLSEKYQNVLRNYQNHSPIDYDMFQISNIDYFEKIAPKKVTPKNIKKVKRKYIWQVYGWYSIMIITPPIFIAGIIIITK